MDVGVALSRGAPERICGSSALQIAGQVIEGAFGSSSLVACMAGASSFFAAPASCARCECWTIVKIFTTVHLPLAERP